MIKKVMMVGNMVDKVDNIEKVLKNRLTGNLVNNFCIGINVPARKSSAMEREISRIAVRVSEEFTPPGGVMDRIAFRWVQTLFRTELRHSIWPNSGGASYRNDGTGNCFATSELYHQINDLLSEMIEEQEVGLGVGKSPFGKKLFGEGLEETWEDRCCKLFVDSLKEWLIEKGFADRILDQDDQITEHFWQALADIEGCEYAWLARFKRLPVNMLKLRVVRSH